MLAAMAAPTSPLGRSPPSIWWWAFGYFAAYVPYAALTKSMSSGPGAATGLELLPPSLLAGVVCVLGFLLVTGWWRKAGSVVAGGRWPVPTLPTLLSGLCSAGIIATTTLAYTFDGISIVFVMLLMRGGLLVLAPVIDVLGHRRPRWYSYLALALALAALIVAVVLDGRTEITVLCTVNVLAYLGLYMVRLTLMGRLAKAHDPATNLRYFVEEQLVSAPALLLALALAALAGVGEIRAGFTSFWDRPDAVRGLAIGVASQLTGLFGGLILLDQRDHSFCIPVNRASSVLAGVAATGVLAATGASAHLPTTELVGAGLVVVAILVLALGPRWSPPRPTPHPPGTKANS